jgi:AsmA protein
MRWVIRIGLGLAVLVLLALGLLAMIPSERVAALLSAQFESATGRKLEITGEIKPRLWPSLGITTGPVSIANADWVEGDAPLFRADSLSVAVNLGALLGGEVQITSLSATAPAFDLERAADGRVNWDLGAAVGGEGSVPAPATPFTLDRGRIEGGSLRLRDRQGDRVIALDDLDAVLDIPDLSGPFSLSATGLSRGHPLQLDLTAEVFSAFLAGRVVPLALDLTAGGSEIGFTGRAGLTPLVAEGRLTADLSDLPALGSVLGETLSQPGPGLGQDRLTLTGQLTLDGTGAVFLRGAELVADGNQLTGDLDLRPGEDRPKLAAQLTAGPLTLATGPEGELGGGLGGGMGADGWPEGEIDVTALATLDAEISLSTPSIDLGVLRLGQTQARITVDRARAVIDIRQMQAYGGQISGDFVVNGRGGLSVGGRLLLAGLQAQPLLNDLAGWDRLLTQGDIELEFLGVGNSIAAIMTSLEGQGALELGQGELLGLNIPEMLRRLDPSYVGEGQSTRFDGLAGTFTITGGVVSNSDLKLVAPGLTAAGAGTVDLGQRSLDYRLRPTALAAEDGSGGVMVPLLITGPWASPRYQLDLEGIAREKMEEEVRAAAEAAEAAARAELERRLEEELGVKIAPDQSLGDAAVEGLEQTLEDETRKALEDILGGN